MRKKPYKRKPGDFEIRILPDGHVCIVAGDEKMFDLAEALDPKNPSLAERRRAKASGKSRDKSDPARQSDAAEEG